MPRSKSVAGWKYYSKQRFATLQIESCVSRANNALLIRGRNFEQLRRLGDDFEIKFRLCMVLWAADLLFCDIFYENFRAVVK